MEMPVTLTFTAQSSSGVGSDDVGQQCRVQDGCINCRRTQWWSSWAETVDTIATRDWMKKMRQRDD